MPPSAHRSFEYCLTQSREAAKGAVPVEIERLATNLDAVLAGREEQT